MSAVNTGSIPVLHDSFRVIVCDEESQEDSLEGARHMASLKTQIEELLDEHSDLEVDHAELYEHLLSEGDEQTEVKTQLAQAGVPQLKVKEIMDEYEFEGGVVLLLSQEMLQKHPLERDVDPGDIATVSLTSLPLEFVVGVIPVSQIEADGLGRLRDGFASLSQAAQS